MYIADKCSTDIAYIIAKPRLSGGMLGVEVDVVCSRVSFLCFFSCF